MRLACLAVLALTVAGCASAPSPAPTAPAALTAVELQRLATRQARDTFGVIGAPNGTETTADGTVYMWRATASSLSYVPNPAMSSGFISSIPAGADATGGGGQNIEHDVICKVRVTAGKDGLIRHLDFNGPHSACDPVAKRLAAWVDSGT